jgi:hypothetical protein
MSSTTEQDGMSSFLVNIRLIGHYSIYTFSFVKDILLLIKSHYIVIKYYNKLS